MTGSHTLATNQTQLVHGCREETTMQISSTLSWLLVGALILGAIGVGCSRPGQDSPDGGRPTLPGSNTVVELPAGWTAREVPASSPGIYFSRLQRYWFAGSQENFDRFDRSAQGPAPDYFFGCVIGQYLSSVTQRDGVALAPWLAQSSPYSEPSMFFLARARPFGSAPSSTAVVVSESGENATRSETIYVRSPSGDFFALSYFVNADMEDRDRALLPQTRSGCEQIARSILGAQ